MSPWDNGPWDGDAGNYWWADPAAISWESTWDLIDADYWAVVSREVNLEASVAISAYLSGVTTPYDGPLMISELWVTGDAA